MSNGPYLITERLILRPPSSEDLAGWAAFCADEDSMRFLGGVQSRAEAWRNLCTMAGAWTIRGFGMFSMVLRDTGTWIGRTGPWQPEGWPGREVGWGVASEYAGQGYAREAAIASIDYAFDILGWDDVIHLIAPGNIRSAGLAERLGSVNRGAAKMPSPFTDLHFDAYGQSKSDWKARTI
ncbi:MAG: GNAT family N-acetyltransferase [Sphingorhabdus sp.]